VRRPAAGGPRRAAQRIGGGLLAAAIAVARAPNPWTFSGSKHCLAARPA